MQNPVFKNGQWVIPATQRADGSWRKEVVVKDGFVPQEETKRYQIPALRADDESYSSNSSKTTGKSGKDDFSIADGRLPPSYQNTTTTIATTTRRKIPGLAPPEPVAVTVKSKEKKSKSTSTNIDEPDVSKLSIHDPSSSNTLPVAAAATTTTLLHEPAVEIDPTKKLKNLKKKLREIMETVEKQSTGKVLSAEQLDKISKRDEIEQAIAALEAPTL